MQSKYVPVADTAKLVREVLKRDFPAVKFSVRSKSYSGGAAIDIHWTDGPTAHQVSDVVSVYEGAVFDSMIDLKSYHDSINDAGETVHYGADFIFEVRKNSREFTLKIAALVADFWGQPVPALNDQNWFDYSPDTKPVGNGRDTIIDLIRSALHYSAYNGHTITLPRTSNHLPSWLEMLEKTADPAAFVGRQQQALRLLTHDWQNSFGDIDALHALHEAGRIEHYRSGYHFFYRLPLTEPRTVNAHQIAVTWVCTCCQSQYDFITCNEAAAIAHKLASFLPVCPVCLPI